MNPFRRSFYYIFLLVDILTIFVSFFYADLLSRARLPWKMATSIQVGSLAEIFILMIFVLIWFFYSRSSGLYDEFKISQLGSQLFILLKNIVMQLIIGVVVLFFLKNVVLSRFFLVLYLSVLSALTLFSRALFRLIRFQLIRKGYLMKRIVVVGSSASGDSYISSLNRAVSDEYIVAGVIRDKAPAGDKEKYLGTLDDTGKVLEKIEADEIVVALCDNETIRMPDILRELGNFPVRVRIIPEYFRFVSHKYQISFFNNLPIVDVINDPLDELHWRILKRVFDIVFSLFVILFFLSWIFPIIALIIKLDSKGPVLFKQERWGKKNRKFLLYKFRSMISSSRDFDDSGKFLQATKSDPRITKAGTFLRKTSLDELPQFINVLKGNMSVVGPRPHAIPQNLESRDKIENYMLRHLVKPGITGWAQVNGFRGETKTDEQMKKRVELDMIYIENWSFLLDLKIIFLTIWKGLKGDPGAY